MRKLILLAWLLPAPALALEIDPDVTPEINLGGRLIATGAFGVEHRPVAGDDEDAELDVSDSTILLNLAKYLYRDRDYGFATFGLLIPEDDSDFEDDVFVNQLVIGIGGVKGEVKLGRTNLPNTLVQFPTLRDDDLLAYTHVRNAGYNAEGEEFQVYGGVLEGAYYFGRGAWSVRGALTARAETDLADLADEERTSTNAFNGLAGALVYELPETIKFDRGLRFAAFGFDAQRPDEIGGRSETDVVALLAGFSYNLNEDPQYAWGLHAQAIYGFGDGVAGLREEVERAQAEQASLVVGLTYAHRPHLQTRWQAGLTLAAQDYREFDEARSFAALPSFAWRLGSGVELVTQYRYERFEGDLRDALDEEASHALWFGVSFALTGTFNESVGQRGSILNIEHSITNPGPVQRGH
jgi:hypothetical protein